MSILSRFPNAAANRLGRGLRALCAAAIALGLGTSARALEFEVRELDGRRVVIAQRDVVAGDSARLAEVLERAGRVDEVWFHSPGGLTVEGYRIGRLLRQRGLATRVPANARCASACTDAFLGGVSRSVDNGGALGVHMPTISRAADARDWVATQIHTHGAEAAGRVIRTFEQLSARETAAWMQYVVEMGISPHLIERAVQVSADSMLWLSDAELTGFNVVTTRPALRTAAGRPLPSTGPNDATAGRPSAPAQLAERRPVAGDGLPRIN